MQGMTGIPCAFVAMLSFGIGGAFWKSPARAVGPVHAVYHRQLYVCTALGLLVLACAPPVHPSAAELATAVGISLFGYLPLLFFLKAISKGVVGIVTGIANAKVVPTILLGQLVFGEQVGPSQWALVVVLVIGLFGLAWEPRADGSAGGSLADGSAEALAACILWGIAYFLFALPVRAIGPLHFAFILETGVMCAAIFHLRVSGSPHVPLPEPVRVPLAICVVCAVIGTISYNLAVATAPVSTVAAISFSAPLVSTLVARVRFNERLRPLQAASMLAIVLALILLSLSKS